MKRLNRTRLIDILYRLSDINIVRSRDARAMNDRHVYVTDAEIVYERGVNSTPQHLFYNHRTSSYEVITNMTSNMYHLHPYCSFKKITALLENEEECPALWKSVLPRCKEPGSGYGLALHKCIKFDGEVQGIPVTHIYCSQTEYYGGNKIGNRFDWVELKSHESYYGDSEVYPTLFGQVCAIIELKIPGNTYTVK